MTQRRIMIVGGGAAGFFAAIAAAEADPAAKVVLLEATAHPLAKVRISGGGRCNVTHACFEPRELVKRYPRGSRELLGPLHRFGPRDTIEWFARRGVTLKTESDGRMFPTTDDSATIVGALQQAAAAARVELLVKTPVTALERREPTASDPARFRLVLGGGIEATADAVIIATGGNRGSAGLGFAQALGHTVEPPVPSLFTFHIDDERLKGLEGLSVPDAEASVPGTRLRQSGPLLITHWGLSGPAVLKLSAWGARELAAQAYQFPLEIAWVGGLGLERAKADLQAFRTAQARRQVSNANPWGLPARLWERWVSTVGLPLERPWAQVSREHLMGLAGQAAAGRFAVTGKSMNKEEFVTCGGIRLREVDFRTMESRLCPALHFAGEVLDIDGVTGGFNFQAAWTTGWLAGRAAAGLGAG